VTAGKQSHARRTLAAVLVGLFGVALVIPIAVVPSCQGGAAASEIEQLRDEACACETSACAGEASDRFIAYLEDHAATDYSAASLKRTERAALEIIDCTLTTGLSDEKQAELTRALEAM
jgi:hypothetical protein